MKKLNVKQQTQSVFNWNQENKIGCNCEVRKDDGETVKTKTRSDAWVLGGHTAVILLKGISGSYLLSRVTAI